MRTHHTKVELLQYLQRGTVLGRCSCPAIFYSAKHRLKSLTSCGFAQRVPLLHAHVLAGIEKCARNGKKEKQHGIPCAMK